MLQDPLQQFENIFDKDIKEVFHHRKKLNGRRLDYDYKRGKLKASSKGMTDEEVNQSYEKLEESIQMAGTTMRGLLSNVDQVAQLSQFVEAMLRFHREVCYILLFTTLQNIISKLLSKIKKNSQKFFF